MRLLRPIVVVALSLLAACNDGPTIPAGAITGVFGGRHLEMISTGRSVRLNFICFSSSVRSSIVPDDDGRFDLPEMSIAGSSPATVALSGHISGDRIDATVRTTGQFGTLIQDYTLMRDQQADYSGIACAVS